MAGTSPERESKIWAELGEKFELEEPEHLPARFVGIKTEVLDAGDGMKIVKHDQSEYCQAILKDFFETEQVSKKKRHTPAPVTPKVYGRETEPVQVEEKETGKYASKAAHYVSSIAYLERGSRPDIATALHLLQQAFIVGPQSRTDFWSGCFSI